MANQYGRNYRIKVKPAGGAAGVVIGGETGFNMKRSSQEQDISDKDGGIYGSTSYGQQKISFSVSGNTKLPDAGYSAIYAASKANPPEIDIEIDDVGTTRYAGRVAVGNFSQDHPTNGPVTFTFDMMNVGAPDTDALDAEAGA